jgi:tRNA (guanine-N7-)-methyltransferase
MGKNKLERWRENETFALLHQPKISLPQASDFELKGRWHSNFFKNSNPITLELGCGRGEYTVNMAKMFPERNFIGIDIKGARLWRGAKTATEEHLLNIAFVRTRIEAAGQLFAAGEVGEIWLTFPDPQPAKCTKRLCSSYFFNLYGQVMIDGGMMHLKTDCRQLYDYALALLQHNSIVPIAATPNLYAELTEGLATLSENPATAIQTAYEELFRRQGSTITYLQFAMPAYKIWTEPADFIFDKNVPVVKKCVVSQIN